MTFWQSSPHPTAAPDLSADEVHVWRASLHPDELVIATLLPLLSADEQVRAQRFYFPKDRDRFILARGRLRQILSYYLTTSPQALQFQYGPTGKPALIDPAELCFNVSHSHQLALYAVAWNREVGVDVERIRPDCDCEAIAARFFSASEQAALRQLNADKLQGFFNGWTRKEAFLKAIGKGLTLPLDQFAVSLTPTEPACLLWLEPNLSLSVHQWSIEALDVGPGYAAAVAAQGQGWRLRGWQVDFGSISS
jgi:4'-phosphopantetheinyl transferase